MQPTHLAELLRCRSSANTGITFIEGSNQEEFMSYHELYSHALKALYVLQEKGLEPGDELVFQLQSNKNFLVVFWACILGGIIPVPLTIGQNDDHRQKLFNVWKVLKKPSLVCAADTLDKLFVFALNKKLRKTYDSMVDHLVDEFEVMNAEYKARPVELNENDIAFIQFSSGSTGTPKGVVLTHKNLITNIGDISKAAAYSENDSTISWMPLTHDMGLIGFHLNPLFSGLQQYIIPTQVFVRNPALWIDKTTEHKVTVLCSPNFGYKYLLRHCDVNADQRWELSHVRIIYNGAEPISTKLCNEFLNAMERFGLKRNAMCPVYGLAEASLAVSISRLEDEVISMKRANDSTVVNVGRAIEHCSLQITDDENNVLPDENIGHIKIKGPNVTSGYYNNAEETMKVLSPDGWLDTGDLGFMKDGCLYVTGRAKDIIFVNGQNYYPHDIESIAEEVEGIELNKIAVAGFFNGDSGRDETIAFVFHRGGLDKFMQIAAALKSVVSSRAGLELDRVIPVKDIPRTTSGKLQRFKLLEQYRQGMFADVEQELQRLQAASVMDAVDGDSAANENEEKLLSIWEQVLNVRPIGVHHRFFEMGGTSLKAAEAAMLVKKVFGVELPLEVLYEKQTVRELAALLPTLSASTYQPIPKAKEQEYYSLSPAQKRLFYNWQLNKYSIAYNIPVAIDLPSSIDVKKLEESITKLIARHDALRMSFHLMDEPVFKVHDDVAFTLLKASKLNELVQPFDLSKAPLFRAALVNDSVLFLDFHHIISDGVSVHNFIQELLQLCEGKELAALPVQYKDYAAWDTHNAASMQEHREYWLNILQGELPQLELPYDLPRPPIFNTEGAKLEYVLGEKVTSKLRLLAASQHCSLHVVLLAIYNVLLSKYTGHEDIITGIPVAGRSHPDLLQLQGMFVNNLAIRSSVKGDESFTAFLAKQKDIIAGALEHQDYPFDELVNALGGRRDVSRNPLFDTMFIYQNMGVADRHFFDPGFSKFDLSMEVFEETYCLKYAIEYATSLFNESTIVGFAHHFENLVNAVIADPQADISTLGVMSAREYDRCVRKFNATGTIYPKEKTILQLFEEQAKKTPDNIAVVFNNEKLSYAELNERSNELSKQLNLQPGDIAAVMLPRSAKLIVTILAILKAGGCYLPIDTDLPEERAKYIVNNSKCKIVITDQVTQTGNTAQLPGIAYIIYTSGTTGNPKGVMIAHHSLVNYITWAAEKYVKGEKVSFPLYTSISFDLTITSIFTPLITGNTIIVYDDTANEIPLERVLQENKVQVIKLTPSHLKMLAGAKFRVALAQSKIRRMIVGGEQLETKLAKEIHDALGGRVEIYNEYGPTEATVGCMIHLFNPAEKYTAVPIGVPAANTQIYVLDKYLNPVPSGVCGELYISGDGVAKGYLFNESLTQQKFIPDPFTVGQLMYKTGDIARQLPGGVLMFNGRADHQVKINGYRIELAEIEKQLEGYQLVLEAVVVARTNSKQQQYLCAYYKSATIIEESVLRNYLAAKLPHYMIPVYFVWLQEIPLTRNGKIDHRALPDPERSTSSKELLPRNKVEALQLKVWSAILNEPGLTLTDNFFELGGDSIKAVQIVSKLNEEGISLQAKDILTYHTIEQVSLHAKLRDASEQYEQGIVSGRRKLSQIEQWFFQQQFVNPGYYNQSVLLKLNKDVNVGLLEQCFTKLISHHDGLRQNYHVAGNCMFYNNAHLDKPLLIGKKIDPNFDITKDLLIRAVLINDKLLITAHHLVIDGVSWRILLEDLYKLYKGESLPRKTANMKSWQQELTSQRKENIEFAIPQDASITDWKFADLGTATAKLDAATTRFLLKEAHHAYRTDVPVLLNTALALSLKEWTGRQNIVVWQEHHGRDMQPGDTGRTIGWFTAMYPVQFQLQDSDIGNCIKSVKEQMRSASVSDGFDTTMHEVRFNYLGQFGDELNNDLFNYCDDSPGLETDGRNTMTAKLELNAMVINNELKFDVQYNTKAHSESTIVQFMQSLPDHLRRILDHIRNENDVHFTPSDFDAVKLDQAELDALFS